MSSLSDSYGTSGGVPITDDVIDRLAADAERGFDHSHLRPRGRPPLGVQAAKVAQVRLPPDLRDALARRAARDGTGVSEVIREALRAYLRP